MWGNQLGWGISAAMVLLVVCFGVWFQGREQLTAPTDLSQNAANLAALPSPIVKPIVEPAESGDAGALYRSAASAYADAADACDDFAQSLKGPPPQPIQDVLDAATMKGSIIFAANPDAIMGYQSDHPPLERLIALGGVMDRAALMFHVRKQPNEAQRYFKAVYSLGLRLYQEQLNYDEYQAGLQLLDESLEGMIEIAPANSPEKVELQHQQQALQDLDRDRVMPIYKVLSNVNQQVIAQNAGDLFVFARRCEDRMLRVEAIKALGRLRFDAGRRADQVGADRVLKQLQDDPDAVVRTAAQQTADLTEEQYRMIH